ncbi:MAG: glycosyltransferase family 4 protein [Gammaproteobacteria bacterium]|nr:glycosyltransferase family 4 protein [Gammaproteobacteria bacterium]
MVDKFYTVVIINDFAYINGGAAAVAIQSARALAERGHQIIFFAAVGQIASELRHQNITIHCLEQFEILKDPNRLRAVMQGIWNFKAEREIKKILLKLNPCTTIVHLHGWTKALSSSVIQAVVKNKFHLVCTIHDYFLACPNGGFFNYQKNCICHLKPLSMKCIFTNCDSRNYLQKLWRVKRQFVQKIFGGAPNKIKNYITISNLSEEIIKPYLPKGAQIFRIDNPISIEKSLPVQVEKNQAFVYIGRLAKEKGVLFLVKIAAKLKIKIIFVGDGELKQQIQSIYPDAIITGWVTTAEISQHLNSARAIILPSLWYETQGLVVTEAAAKGVPAIVSDQCAATEFVDNGITGFWFESGDADDLAAKISLFQNDETVKKLGFEAYSRYWQYPKSVAEHVSLLENCYNNILSNN